MAALGNKNQKLQELKKQKAQQAKQDGSARSGSRKGSAVAKKKGGAQYKMPAKNRAFDSAANNDDLDGMFEEEALMGGDEGAPPMDDDFAAGDLLEGDQAENPDASIQFNDEEDDDLDADEEDKEFLKEITKPAKKPAKGA